MSRVMGVCGRIVWEDVGAGHMPCFEHTLLNETHAHASRARDATARPGAVRLPTGGWGQYIPGAMDIFGIRTARSPSWLRRPLGHPAGELRAISAHTV